VPETAVFKAAYYLGTLGTCCFGILAAATFPIFVIGLLTALVKTLGCISVELMKCFGLSEFAWPSISSTTSLNHHRYMSTSQRT